MSVVRATKILVLLAAVAGFAPAALAGPPLICHPFVTDAASPMLPWVGTGSLNWYSMHPDYDVKRLTSDTLKVLSPDAPILARMENMRRAAIYAEQDIAVAEALLAAVLARADEAPKDPRAAALAWFDAGYLLETYRQLDVIYQHEMRPRNGRVATIVPVQAAGIDAYALVQKAAVLAPDLDGDIAFAASLMVSGPVAAEHRRRAAAAAVDGSLLARNLERLL
jgi:hypothetical protein